MIITRIQNKIFAFTKPRASDQTIMHLCQKIGLSCLQTTDINVDFTLCLADDGYFFENSQQTPLFKLDFNSPSFQYLQQSLTKSQPIAKAVGLANSKQPLKILDTTAGFGRDSFILTAFGCEVTCLEQHPIIALTLDDAISHAKQNCTDLQTDKWTAHCINSIDYLKRQSKDKSADIFDVIYLDPMFPDRYQKSALAKKSMQLLQSMVATDLDYATLLTYACTLAKSRVVVKRPANAPYLSNLKPNFTTGMQKTTRFDVYISG